MNRLPEHKKAKLHQLVDNLRPEQLDEAEALLEQLRYQVSVGVKARGHTIRLGSLWKGVGIEITEEDIAEARREMWGRLGKEDAWDGT